MKIKGLTLDEDRIYSVELETAPKQCFLTKYELFSLSELLSKLSYESSTASHTVLMLPKNITTFRNLEFPTRSKKIILSGIDFELEDDLPFSLQDAFYDYSLLPLPFKKKGALVHVALSLKTACQSFLAPFQTPSFDPPYLTSEAWAYRSFMNRMLPVENQVFPNLLVLLGAQKTTFYLHANQHPLTLSEIPWGTHILSETTAPSEAHFEKVGFPLLQEIRKKILISKTMTTHPLTTVYLSEEPCPGFQSWLDSKIQAPTQLIDLSKNFNLTFSEEFSSIPSTFIPALSTAFCLIGKEKSICINFRKQIPVQNPTKKTLNWSHLKRPIVSFVAVFFFFILNLMIQKNVYQEKSEFIQKKLEKGIQKFFSTTAKGAIKTYLSNKKLLETSIQKELQETRHLSSLFGPNPRNPLPLLSVLSNQISKDILIELSEFSLGEESAENFQKLNTEQPSVHLSLILYDKKNLEKVEKILNRYLKNLKQEQIENLTKKEDPESEKWKVFFSGVLKEQVHEF